MQSLMCNISEIKDLLQQKKRLFIAGDTELLKQIPKGDWIAGSIPYFMAPEGGLITKEKAFITVLPDDVHKIDIQFYDEKSIQNIYSDAPENGFSLIIIPAMSATHLSFALQAPKYKDFASRPLVGWISGVHLTDLEKLSPQVFNGKNGESSDKKAIVMKVFLNRDHACNLEIVNIFKQGTGDKIVFLENDFTVKNASINGKVTNFVDYLKQKKVNMKFPLVADYAGANINVSFQLIDEKEKIVKFYAPVFKGVEYKLAAPITNYVQDFKNHMPHNKNNILFSCNCILNFLYSELEGKKTGGITGPITFGEIAYQLLNQTLVYLTIDKVHH